MTVSKMATSSSSRCELTVIDLDSDLESIYILYATCEQFRLHSQLIIEFITVVLCIVI